MSDSNSNVTAEGANKYYFVTTLWTLVLRAQSESDPQADAALARLCSLYWYPLYAYVRRKGHSPHDAEDLTQEFFSRLLAKQYLRSADPGKGRFRYFLLGTLEHFLAKEWNRAHRQKRGGGRTILSLDSESAEARYCQELTDTATPERLFDRRWALTLIERALERLREDYATAQQQETFARLQGFISGDKPDMPYTALASHLNTSEGALKVAIHRLRKRYGECLREEVAQTVERPEEIGDEIQYLFRVLRE
jgi:RNA polymerase sigma factor (sigma-70 family)